MHFALAILRNAERGHQPPYRHNKLFKATLFAHPEDPLYRALHSASTASSTACWYCLPLTSLATPLRLYRALKEMQCMGPCAAVTCAVTSSPSQQCHMTSHIMREVLAGRDVPAADTNCSYFGGPDCADVDSASSGGLGGGLASQGLSEGLAPLNSDWEELLGPGCSYVRAYCTDRGLDQSSRLSR